jgi:hypothetical protein
MEKVNFFLVRVWPIILMTSLMIYCILWTLHSFFPISCSRLNTQSLQIIQWSNQKYRD